MAVGVWEIGRRGRVKPARIDRTKMLIERNLQIQSRRQTMDFRIRRSTVQGLVEQAYFWALIEPVWPDAAVKNEFKRIKSATPGQRALYLVTLCIREVSNGGLDQFFSNSSGMYSMEVREAFRLLGADEHAAAFEKAIKIFPGGRVPADHSEREEILESILKARRKAFFEPLNEEFFDESRIYPHFQRYVDLHPEEFFVD